MITASWCCRTRAACPARWKYLLQCIAGADRRRSTCTAAPPSPAETALIVPFFKDIVIPLGVGYMVLTYFFIVGFSNAVNLTDGLDGLAIMPAVFVAVGAGYFCLRHRQHGDRRLPRASPTLPAPASWWCSAARWPAPGWAFCGSTPTRRMVFMGDIGALAVGAALGLIAVLVRQELVFVLMAGLFVMETVSVILQVVSFKLTGKRIFRMAPIHHHFELKGWPEPRVIVRFWIISVVLVLMGLATLKIR